MKINVYALRSSLTDSIYAVNLKGVNTGRRFLDDAQVNGEYVGSFTTMRGYRRILNRIGLEFSNSTQMVNTIYNGKELLTSVIN